MSVTTDRVLERIAAVPRHEALAPIPWPKLAPRPTPVARSPEEPMPAADVLVLTWTSAEGMGLADVMTPGVPVTSWLPYALNWASYESQLTGRSPAAEAKCMAHYSVTEIGSTTVVVAKSELHLATDARSAPIVQLWGQMVRDVAPQLVITTGTAGGVPAQAELGDVFVVTSAKFNCTKTFASEPWAQQRFTGPEIAAGPEAQSFGALVEPNAAHLRPLATRDPQLTFGGDVETVDSFVFANSADTYGLASNDPLARTDEMDDATLPLALSSLPQPPRWCSVRNVSDPQVPTSVGNLDAQAQWANDTYTKYGYWTTIGSAIACWAIIANL